MKASPRDTVVLLHGLGRTPRSMLALRFWLGRAGYRVVNVGYPSRRVGIQEAVERWLKPALARLALEPGTQVHFVTHSLGGIVFRAWAESRDAAFPLGRTVMLGAPNQGSEVAAALGNQPWADRLMGPALRELGQDEYSVPKRLGAVPPGTGVIMGNKAVIPFFRRLLGGESDGVVTVQGGRVQGQTDFLVAHADHTSIMWRPSVLRAVKRFLECGFFSPVAA